MALSSALKSIFNYRVSADIWETYFLIDAIITISCAIFLRSTSKIQADSNEADNAAITIPIQCLNYQSIAFCCQNFYFLIFTEILFIENIQLEKIR